MPNNSMVNVVTPGSAEGEHSATGGECGSAAPRIAMIWLSVNFDFLIALSFKAADVSIF
jgi:hypothetical protein